MFLVAYFFAPDRISAGNLTHRFGLFFFLALLVFLATRPMPRWSQVLALVVVFGVLGASRMIHSIFLAQLNEDISEIQEMTPYLEAGSTVESINTSSNWVHKHFLLYTGDKKELVHLRNPQCAGQFPVRWNEYSLPECYMGDVRVLPKWAPDIGGLGHRKVQVDYIILFDQKSFREVEVSPHWQGILEEHFALGDEQDWRQVLEKHYELVMHTSQERGALYRKSSRCSA